MATKAKRHIHKYHKVDTGTGQKVWACALPDCSHFMPPHYENLVLGKSTYCWGCSEVFIIDTDNMKQEKPICMDCSLMKPLINEMNPLGSVSSMRNSNLEEGSSIANDEEAKLCTKCGKNYTRNEKGICVPCIAAM